ncbi:MAG: hypothetical protein GX951_01400 [Mollicutes bacterium]|nr:hypothetical protein [Mollicutes bacterium]
MYRIIEKFINRESYFEKEEQSVTKYILVPIALALKVKNVSKYNDYISGNGEQVISEFFDYIEGYDDNGINYMEWLMEMLKVEDKSKAKEEFIKMYKNGIKNSKLVRGFPFLDIISMLGNTLNQY